MKKIVYGLLATLSGLVLLLSYRTSLGEAVPAATVMPDANTPASPGASPSASPGAPASTGSTTASTTADSGGYRDGTYTGAEADTRYGVVQVRVTVGGGRITAVEVPAYPDGNGRDRQINERAVPQLVSETVAAQSADIHLVSGATYTSNGYLASLQSALDQAAR